MKWTKKNVSGSSAIILEHQFAIKADFPLPVMKKKRERGNKENLYSSAKLHLERQILKTFSAFKFLSVFEHWFDRCEIYSESDASDIIKLTHDIRDGRWL